MSGIDLPTLYTLREGASMVGIGQGTLRRAIRDGKLDTVQSGAGAKADMVRKVYRHHHPDHQRGAANA